MSSKATRPLGITLLALIHLWIGCLGTIVFPFIVVSGAFSSLHLMLEPVFHSEANIVAPLFLAAWFAMYVLYAWIGYGLWTLKNPARKAVLWIALFGMLSGLLLSGYLAVTHKIDVTLIAAPCILLVCYPLSIAWYLQTSVVRMAFKVIPFDPAQGKRSKTIPIAITCVFLATIMVAVRITTEHMFTHSPVYAMALNQAQASACVAAQIGPFHSTSGTSGSFTESSDSGEADLRIPVQGTIGSGHLNATGDKQAGQWSITSLVFDQGKITKQLIPQASEGCK